jgi:hypothetical protein
MLTLGWEAYPAGSTHTPTGSGALRRAAAESLLHLQVLCGLPGVPLLRARGNPIVLHDDSLSDDLARVVTDIGLVQRMGDVAAGGGEVGYGRGHRFQELRPS